MICSFGRVRGAALLLSAMVLTACERVVSVETPEGVERLVVEARLERVQGRVNGRQAIRLTTSDSYFSNDAQPVARGAVVLVRSSAGDSVRFSESPTEPGVYETSSLVLQSGRVYTLRIDYAGDRYEAVETALRVPPIDSLFFAPRKTNVGPKEGLRATIFSRDIPGEDNWYLWDQYVDGRRLVVADSTQPVRAIGSDLLIDGREVLDFQPYDAQVVKSGQVVLMRQMALSESLFRYFTALSEQTGNAGSPFDVPSASLRGNVANLTDPARRPLGYFMVTEVAEASARVP